MKKRLYPSSSAFMWGDTVLTEYDSGCLRSILLRAHGAVTSIPKVFERVGAAHEDWYENVLKQDPTLITFSREVVIKQPIEGAEGVLYSGRMDVLAAHKAGTVIHETKGTISKNSRLSVIRKGLVKLNQLAQLVSYMIVKQVPRGKLVVGYYEEDEHGALVHQEGREFKVEIDDSGSILVDGTPSGYSVFDQIAHRQAAAKVLAGNVVAARPDKWDQKWGGPCGNCVFKSACDRYDQGQFATVEEYIDAGREAARDAEANKGVEPEPFKTKSARPAKKARKAKRKES